jgi:Ser/Thr protein kinase RdoA (MazF antagonist)
MSMQLSADSLRFNPPEIPVPELARFMAQQYGMSGSMEPLRGERDQNLRVTADDGRRCVLKVSHRDEDPSSVDFQVGALEHIRRTAPDLCVPRHIPGHDDELTSILHDDKGRPHIVRLLTYVEGVALEEFGALSNGVIRQIGKLQGRLCTVLASFSHPAATAFMPWDSMNGLVVSAELRNGYLPPALAEVCEPVLERLEHEALPRMHRMPAQVIHNDVHAGNVLCDANQPDRVTGLIDFGDMVQRPIVVDLSTSLANIAEHNSNVVEASRELLSGFESVMPLSEDQREVLYDALCARMILTVQLMNFYAAHSNNPGEYGADFIADATLGLERVLAISRD